MKCYSFRSSQIILYIESPKAIQDFLMALFLVRRLDHAKWQNQMDERLIFLQMWVPYNSHFDL